MGSDALLQDFLQKEVAAVWAQRSVPVPLCPPRFLLPEASRKPIPAPELPLQDAAGGLGQALEETGQLGGPLVLSAPRTKAGLGVGCSTWRLWVAAVTTCEWGERKQVVAVPKKRGRWLSPRSHCSLPRQRLLWGLALGPADLGVPGPKTVTDLQGSAGPSSGQFLKALSFT